MTDQQHPITPPPELIQRWWEGDNGALDEFDEVVKEAARWGADEELEACLDQLRRWGVQGVENLRNTRRPNLKSRKQRALDALTQIENQCLSAELAAEIRNALEELPDD